MDEPKAFTTLREGGPLEVNRCPECKCLASWQATVEQPDGVRYRCDHCMVEWYVKYEYRRVEHPGAPKATP